MWNDDLGRDAFKINKLTKIHRKVFSDSMRHPLDARREQAFVESTKITQKSVESFSGGWLVAISTYLGNDDRYEPAVSRLGRERRSFAYLSQCLLDIQRRNVFRSSSDRL